MVSAHVGFYLPLMHLLKGICWKNLAVCEGDFTPFYIYPPDELLEYEEKKRQAEEEKQPLPELVRAKVPFSSCLEAYGAPEQVDDFWSTALQAKSVALK